jgi:hypothetical protein
MATQLVSPVRNFAGLPNVAQNDLKFKGIKPADFDKMSPELRLSVLNLYVKLKSITIAGPAGWMFIKKIVRIDVGIVDFEPTDFDALWCALTAEWNFVSPWAPAPLDWNSREKVPYFSLHFKHSEEWGKRMTMHIDPVGLYSDTVIPDPSLLPAHLWWYS